MKYGFTGISLLTDVVGKTIAANRYAMSSEMIVFGEGYFMADSATSQSIDQQHPQWNTDRQVVNQLLGAEPTDYNLAELARLIIRYRGFPGGRDIQADLVKILKQWSLSEPALFEKTRAIHAQAQIYSVRSNKREDWN
jgi:hypothetical protein